MTISIHDSSGNAGGAAQIPQANAINDKSHPNSTTNIHDSSGYAGGAAQIPQVNAINDNDKSFTIQPQTSMFLPGYAGGAAQIPQANTINDKSPTNIHDSSGYAGGAAQIPLLQVPTCRGSTVIQMLRCFNFW